MRSIPLHTLAPGARFTLPGDDGTPRRTGTLVYANECRARVKWDGDARHVELSDGREFDVAGKAVDIAAGTMVNRIDS